jgi:DNA-binding protein HU-beta
MTKKDLVRHIAITLDIPLVKAERIVDATLEAIVKALGKDGRVSLAGFGTFVVSRRVARSGRNPQTGVAITISAKKIARFRAGADLVSVLSFQPDDTEDEDDTEDTGPMRTRKR